VRRQYVDVARSRLKSGGWSKVLDAGVKALAPLVPLKGGRAETGPMLGTAILSYACNYRCGFCELPQRSIRRRREGWTEFDTQGWKSILHGFATLRTAGVGFTGGEPFVRADCADLLEHSLSLGMVTHVNTNGHLLNDALIARLVGMGLDSVNISLDGADAETHDRLRGHAGSFERVTDRIAALARARDASKSSRRTRVAITSVLTPDNAEQVVALADLAERLGADSLGFIPMHEYVGRTQLDEVAPERPWAAKMARAVEELQRLKTERTILENSDGYIALFSDCFAGRPSPIRCHAPESSLVVDCYGRVFPCVPMSEVDRPIGRVKPGGLASFWKSERYSAARRDLASCRACYWNCHTEMNLMWGSRRTAAPAGGDVNGAAR
jgi:MoaA/NifB/PqqE/SkfB family radical SAM enzyme